MTFKTGMNSQQIEYFRRRLILWRDELTIKSTGTAYDDGEDASLDMMGQAANATNSHIGSQSQDREQNLVRKINEALHRIETGTYGMGKSF